MAFLVVCLMSFSGGALLDGRDGRLSGAALRSESRPVPLIAGQGVHLDGGFPAAGQASAEDQDAVLAGPDVDVRAVAVGARHPWVVAGVQRGQVDVRTAGLAGGQQGNVQGAGFEAYAVLEGVQEAWAGGGGEVGAGEPGVEPGTVDVGGHDHVGRKRDHRRLVGRR
jgi:hypothetical protein